MGEVIQASIRLNDLGLFDIWNTRVGVEYSWSDFVDPDRDNVVFVRFWNTETLVFFHVTGVEEDTGSGPPVSGDLYRFRMYTVEGINADGSADLELVRPPVLLWDEIGLGEPQSFAFAPFFAAVQTPIRFDDSALIKRFLEANGGDDTFRLSAGNDLVRGYGGDDYFDFGGTAGRAFADGGDGQDRFTGGAFSDIFNGEAGNDFLAGGDGNDVLYGGSGNDSLRGSDGADSFFGGLGDDTVRGGDGDDRLWMDEGDDLLDGDRGVDWVIARNSGAMRYDFNTYSRQDTGFGMDLLGEVENVSGTHGRDVLIGHDRLDYDNIFLGRGHNDTLSGGGGNDRLEGGRGNDLLLGGDDNDVLLGSTGRDTLDGGAGRDRINPGKDTDRDVIVFSQASDSTPGRTRDKINRFDRGEDKISLVGIDADVDRAGNQELGFATSAQAHSAWVYDRGERVLLRADVDGDARMDFEVLVLVGHLGSADLWL